MAVFHRRQVTSLSGLWDFAFVGQVDPQAVQKIDRLPWEKIWVPSAFDALPRHAGQRGVALYQTKIEVPPGRPARIEFDAVSIWAKVLVDGQALVEHACGYAPFAVDLPLSSLSQRTVTVVVDNRFNFEQAPMHEPYFDFYQYGGIIREARLHVLPRDGAWIESVQVTPTDGYAEGEVEVAIQLSSGAKSHHCTLQFDEAPSFKLKNTKVGADGKTRLLVRVPDAKSWSPEQPHLHHLRVVLQDNGGEEMDDFGVRFGLRRIEARQGALWLNGQRLRLCGYNRHEWHPNYGPSTPTLQMVADLQILRDLGCNFIRGGHYPQDQRFLDLCDELGFLFWEENLGWQTSSQAFIDAKFREDHEIALRAMVAKSYNHPSIIIWGFLNEAETDQDYVRPLFKQTVATLRELDSSRLISYASRLAETDLYFDLVDLISINIYPGWYDCVDAERPLDLIAPRLAKCLASIDARGFQGKPVIVSEIGAEAIYGWHDLNNDFFTEEYQAEYLRRACSAVFAHPRCSGIAFWHFSDFRASEKGRSLQRPRAFNNKGTLDEYRRPKAAYKVVRAAFLEERASVAPASEANGHSRQPVVSKSTNGAHHNPVPIGNAVL